MADYKELLRRAISALPENNGAARRAVYEKARSALVGQLRAIQPPLPARDITQHRLQLEDCIRQVEQEASEAVISLGRDTALTPRPPAPAPATPAPAPAQTAPAPVPAPRQSAPVAPVVPAEPPAAAEKPKPEAKAEPVGDEPAPVPAPPAAAAQPPAQPAEPEVPAPKPTESMSIEDIIAQAAATTGAKVQKAEPAPQPFTVAPVPLRGSEPTPLKSPIFSPRRDAVAPAAANAGLAAGAPAPRIEPSLGSGAALARRAEPEPIAVAETPVEAALSSVREVELETDDTREAEGAIERAIETLDREARGEPTDPLPDRPAPAATPLSGDLAEGGDDSGFVSEPVARSGAGLTIFLVVFALLLVGVGGAGFWAWREGYVDLDQMFGRAQPAQTATTTTETPTAPTMDSTVAEQPVSGEGTTGPGNTATTTTAEPTSALEGLEVEDRLEPTPDPVSPTGQESVLPSINGEPKTEERLSGADTSIAATNDLAASVDPAVLAGSQSLLLEASPDGTSGAVPFSGTVEWSKGVDEIGLPTLIAEASIPARNLGVSVTIRKNADPSLPASHLMEVNFNVTDTFIGGSISSLPGILLKNEELVPGTPLIGASARVVGNSFLFALSAAASDAATNSELMETRRWMDLAVVYGTGRNAILTLEKDEEAQALFNEVFAAWSE